MKNYIIQLFQQGFLLLIILGLNSTLIGQDLERKGTFGAHMENVKEGKGIHIIRVIDNTTASNIGLENSDVILSVNDKAFENVNEFVDYIGTWHSGDDIKAIVKRGKKEKKLSGKVVGKPLETSENGKIVYGSVEFDNGKLRSILELPNDVDNPPVVLFLPGIGCGSFDYYYNPNAPMKQLVEGLVKKGIAVYRVEKPGMGDSEGTTQDCYSMDYNYEVAAYEAALKKLQTISEVNTDQIFLYGHSLGVVTASVIAPKYDVAGVIAWGGISSTWFEYSMKLQRKQKILMGMDYEDVDEQFRKVLPFYYDFYVKKMSKEELLKNPDYVDFVKSSFYKNLWHGLHDGSFFHTLNDVNISTGYKNANCPVLALAGEFDLHTIDTDWAKELADVVNHYRPNQGEYVIIPQTTHHYHTIPSMELYNQMRQDGTLTDKYMAAHFNHDVPTVVSKWIIGRLDKKDIAKN